MLVPIFLATHVLSVVIWIGGVVFVTLIVFPMITRLDDSMEKVMLFQGVEHRFSKIAKVCVAVAGITGAALMSHMGMWQTLFTSDGIGPSVMLIVWTFYVLVLLFEGVLFKLLFRGDAQHDTKRVFRHITVFHWVVMILSLTAIFIGTFKGHGG